MSEGEGFDKTEFPLHAVRARDVGRLPVRQPPAARRPRWSRRWPRSLGKFAAWRLGELRPGRRIEYDVRANWKLFFQNFSECYHCPRIHPELTRLSDYRSGANDLTEGPILGGYMAIDPPGDSLTLSGRPACPPLLAVGRRRPAPRVLLLGLPQPLPDPAAGLRHVARALAGRGRPHARRLRVAVRAGGRGGGRSGPQDAVAFWDRTNRQDWHVCELAQQGVSSRAYVPGPYNVQESLLAAFDRELLAALGRDTA